MAPVRVLIVDDSVVIRRLLTDLLTEDPELEVVGSAPNGRIALQKLPQLTPDIVLLDVEMPELSGLETLPHLRKAYPRLPVIMFSTLTERGAVTTLEALSLGASDYITKPSNTGSMEGTRQRIRADLIPRIKLLAGRGRRPEAAPGAPAAVPAARPPVIPRPPVPRGPASAPSVVVIGVSTGGPNALTAVLPELPADFPVPVLIVQHMPPLFTRFLAERLAARCRLPVCEAAAGQPVTPGRIYIAPGDWHMELEGTAAQPRVRLHQGPLENSCRPAVDPLFRSAVALYGPAVLGVVLTGMGQDGCRGAEAIRSAGGQVLAQDEATSVVWGMPGFVVHAGLADRVVPLEEVGTEIVRRAAGTRVRAVPA